MVKPYVQIFLSGNKNLITTENIITDTNITDINITDGNNANINNISSTASNTANLTDNKADICPK